MTYSANPQLLAKLEDQNLQTKLAEYRARGYLRPAKLCRKGLPPPDICEILEESIYLRSGNGVFQTDIQDECMNPAKDKDWQTGMRGNRLDFLPTEIQVMIMGFAPDVETLRSLARSSSTLCIFHNQNIEELSVAVTRAMIRNENLRIIEDIGKSMKRFLLNS